MDMGVTVGLLLVEILVFALCYWRERRPVNPNRPRLIPYRLIMMTLIVIFLATIAHTISLATGHTVKPRTKMGM